MDAAYQRLVDTLRAERDAETFRVVVWLVSLGTSALLAGRAGGWDCVAFLLAGFVSGVMVGRHWARRSALGARVRYVHENRQLFETR